MNNSQNNSQHYIFFYLFSLQITKYKLNLNEAGVTYLGKLRWVGLHSNNLGVLLQVRTDPGGGQRGPGPPWVHFFFLQIIYIIFVVASIAKPQAPLQLTTIQPKNLTKSIKTFTMLIVYQQPKKKTILSQKNHLLLEKAKLNFLQLQ